MRALPHSLMLKPRGPRTGNGRKLIGQKIEW